MDCQILIIFLFLVQCVSVQSACNCDPISQTCVAGSCQCKAGYQPDGIGGCCPSTLQVQNGMCFAVNKNGALLYPAAIKYCTDLGTGVNLLTFDNVEQYEGLLGAISSQLNDGAPLALGLARSNGMGGYDSDADWVVLATMQSPSYAPFSDTQAKPSGVISYFVKKSGTTPPFIMGDINEAPSFSVTAMGMNIPLNGFIVACRYYSGNNIAPTITPPTGPGTLTTCSGGCPAGQYGLVSSFTNRLTCCSGTGDTTNCNSPYSCVTSAGTGYTCCQTGSASCALPTIPNAKIYWKKSVSGSSAPQVGDIITVYCNSGYILAGKQGLLCMADNTWSDSMPTCTAVTCTDNGIGSDKSGCSTIGTPYLPGSIAKFFCNPQTYAVGKNVRTQTFHCSNNGQWLERFEPCQTGCIAPSSPTNGEFKVLGDLNVLGNPGPMTSVSFKCASGYYLGGPRVITCQYDGSYNGTTPECFKDESEEFWWWPFILGFLLFVCGFFNIFAFLWRRIEKLSTKKDNASKK